MLMLIVNFVFAIVVTILLNLGGDALAASAAKELPFQHRIQSNVRCILDITCRFLALCCLAYICYLAGPQWKPVTLGCLIGYAGQLNILIRMS